ncbi:MAG: hypothetical protein IT364_11690 [Candidatus Hydrogenedentes bacterium]|nr:hypothetical protein [Candidatus Hydrogenedentota bacterium]
MTALEHCQQRLNAARGGVVAIFVIDGKVFCTAPSAKRYQAALRDWPGSLMGHYTSAVDARWLAEDLAFMGVNN